MKNLLRLAIFLGFLSFSSTQAASPKIQVAITVDDLPKHSAIPRGLTRTAVAEKMLKVLKKHHVPEVYGFINAAKLKDDPELISVLKLWREAGYPLGNHTYSHLGLTKGAEADFEREILQNEETLKALGNGTDWKYFRYPFLQEGDTLEKRNGVRKFLMGHGYKIAQVTIDFEDWSWNTPYARCHDQDNQASIHWLHDTYLQNAVDTLEHAVKVSDFLYHRPISHILLLHVGAFDAEMLDELLSGYEKHGVEWIPLSKALQDRIYDHDPGYVEKHSAEFIYQVMKERGSSTKDILGLHYTNYPEEKLEKECSR